MSHHPQDVDMNERDAVSPSSDPPSTTQSTVLLSPPSPTVGSRRARVDDDDDDNDNEDSTSLHRNRTRQRTYSPPHPHNHPLPVSVDQQPPTNVPPAVAHNSDSSPMPALPDVPSQPVAHFSIVFDGITEGLPGAQFDAGMAFSTGPILGDSIPEALQQMITAFSGSFTDREPDESRAKRILNGLEKVPRGLVRRMNDVGGVMGDSVDRLKQQETACSTCAVCWEPLLEDGLFAPQPASNPEPLNVEMAVTDQTTEIQCAPSQEDVTALPCRHVFHASCLVPWFSRQTTCPSCRFDLDPEGLTWRPPLFFHRETQARPLNGAAHPQNANLAEIPPLSDPTIASIHNVNVRSDTHSIGENNPPRTSTEQAAPHSDTANNNSEQLAALMNAVPPEVRTMLSSLLGPNLSTLTAVRPHGVLATQSQTAPPAASTVISPNSTEPDAAQQHTSAATVSADSQPDHTSAAALPPVAIAFVQSVAAATASPIPVTTNRIGIMPSVRTPVAPNSESPSRSISSHPSTSEHVSPPNRPNQSQGNPVPGPGGAIRSYLQAIMRSNLVGGTSPIQNNDRSASNDADLNRTAPTPNTSNSIPNVILGTSVSFTVAGNVMPPPSQSVATNASNVTLIPNLTLSERRLAPDPYEFLVSAFGGLPPSRMNHGNSGNQPSVHPTSARTATSSDQPTPQPAQTAVPISEATSTASPAQTVEPSIQFQSYSVPIYIDESGNAHTMEPPAFGSDSYDINVQNTEFPLFPTNAEANAETNPMTTPTTVPQNVNGSQASRSERNIPIRLPFEVTHNSPFAAQQHREWTVPEGRGPSIRARVEAKEQEYGLRCSDPSCGFAPTDDCPNVVELGNVAPKERVLILKDSNMEVKSHICDHRFHPGCLVTAARIAGFGLDAGVGTVEVSCPVCRAQGHVEQKTWEAGLEQLCY